MSTKIAKKIVKNHQMDEMEVEFCGGFNVCVWLSSCPPVLRFIASATTTAGQTFKLYLIQNKMKVKFIKFTSWQIMP